MADTTMAQDVVRMTPEQLRWAAHAAIARELGAAGLARYLRETAAGNGDYTAERSSTLPKWKSDEEMLGDLRRALGNP